MMKKIILILSIIMLFSILNAVTIVVHVETRVSGTAYSGTVSANYPGYSSTQYTIYHGPDDYDFTWFNGGPTAWGRASDRGRWDEDTVQSGPAGYDADVYLVIPHVQSEPRPDPEPPNQ